MSGIRHTKPQAELVPRGEETTNIELLERLAPLLDPAELEREVLELLAERLPGRQALVALTRRASEPSRVKDPGGSVRCWNEGDPVPRLLAAPVAHGRESLGWIAWAAVDPDQQLDERSHAALLEIAAAAAIPVRNAQRYSAALELSLKDPLTGLFNRRGFDDFLDRALENTRRYGHRLALVLVDLDNFKDINDNWGHPVGDAALRRMGQVLMSEARRSDVVARIGGDEFAVMLPASDARSARRLGARILRRLGRLEFSPAGCEELLRLSASIGVADLQTCGNAPDTLIEMTDRALLAAKRDGGGRISVAKPHGTQGVAVAGSSEGRR